MPSASRNGLRLIRRKKLWCSGNAASSRGRPSSREWCSRTARFAARKKRSVCLSTPSALDPEPWRTPLPGGTESRPPRELPSGPASSTAVDRLRNGRGRFDLVQDVAIALEESDRLPVQSEDLVRSADWRMRKSGLMWKLSATTASSGTGRWSCKPRTGRGRPARPIRSAGGSRTVVLGQLLEPLQERSDLARGVFVPQRLLHASPGSGTGSGPAGCPGVPVGRLVK